VDRPSSGFTLIELMVVILIISVVAAIVLPRLPQPESTKLKSSARNLATGIRFLNDQAMTTKSQYNLTFDLTESVVKITRHSAAGDELPPDDAFFNRPLIEDGISIEDVVSSLRGKAAEGQFVVPFGPNGNAEALMIHLKGGAGHYTIIAYPDGGKVTVQEGYQEELS